jgi:predicted RNA-binding protein with PIN domain
MSDGAPVTSARRRVGVPPIPEHLMTPLLDTAGEVLRGLEAHERPAAVRRLAGFDPRGLKTEAARQQLWRALEVDDEFHDRVVERFRERAEVVAALDGWSADEVFRRVAEAGERSDLPLLASALYAARPKGWAFGIGAAAASVERQRLEREEEEERKARAGEIASLDESRRRVEEARVAAEEEAGRLARQLRDERHGRRTRETEAEQAAEDARTRLGEIESELAKAEAALETAEARARREVERARGLERDLGDAKRALADSERTRAELTERLETSAAPGSGLRHADLEALADAARLAERLARGLGGVAERARAVGTSGTPARGEPDAREATRAVTAEPARRVTPPVPPGMVADSPDALSAMLRAPGVVLVIDGYNVSMLGWGDAALADQRERLGAAIAQLNARVGCDVTLVFDGADVEGVRPIRRPGVRVVFSAAGEEADRVVVREVAALSKRVAAVVASSDGEVRAGAEGEGAVAVSSATLLSVLRA